MKRLALFFIRLYQSSRLFRSRSCRFYPSCSSYAYEAVERHGTLKGLLLSLWRLFRCHPFNSGGIDEVPQTSGFIWKTAGSTELTRYGD